MRTRRRNIKLCEFGLLLLIVVGFVLMGGATNNFSYALQPQSSSDEVELFSDGEEIVEQPTLDIQNLLGANFDDVRHLFGTEISHGPGNAWFYAFDTGLVVDGYNNRIIAVAINYERARSLTEINFHGIDGTSTYADVIALLGDSLFNIFFEDFSEEQLKTTVYEYWVYENEFVRFWFGENDTVRSIVFFERIYSDYAKEVSEPEDYAETITVMLDGQRIEFTDQQPVIIDGRTLVPVRGVFEQLGFEVSWNPETQQATLVGESTIVITVGNNMFMIDGSPGFFDVPAQTIGGRIMLPLRPALEGVGFILDWDAPSSTVIIATQPDLTLIWRVEPTLDFEMILLCNHCGFFAFTYNQSNPMLINEITGETTGYLTGGGFGVTQLLYDEALGLFGEYYGDESGDELSWHTASEFLSTFPYFANNLNLFYGIDSTKIIVTYGENPMWNIVEALTGSIALAHGTDFVTGFYFEDGEWSDWRDGQRWNHTAVAVRQGGNWGIIDINGNVVAPFIFEHAITIDSYTAFVKYNGFYGILYI